MDDLTFFARSRGLDPHDVLIEVSRMSGREAMLGMMSVAVLLDNRAERCGADRAVARNEAPLRR